MQHLDSLYGKNRQVLGLYDITFLYPNMSAVGSEDNHIRLKHCVQVSSGSI